jgi:LmbE family N-acetylglucosaminyl deacetylase
MFHNWFAGVVRGADLQSAVRQVCNPLIISEPSAGCRLKIGDTTDCKSALRLGARLRQITPGVSLANAGERTSNAVGFRTAAARAFACLLVALAFNGRGAEAEPGALILEDLQNFREMGSVLFVAAHPDDENTQLITYLARGKRYRTAYLSLTRGDGGQNVLGPEFGEELGVIRTQELLAARRLDGGRQFFTRAIDFGFSKSAAETLRIWDRQQVVADIVRVMRLFRPDVVITRFSPKPGGTHGHHTASAILALEAFKLAGDPKAFPEQLNTLTPWRPKRILWNGFSRGGDEGTNANVLRLEIAGEDTALKESFGEIAGRSRSMHKTQGFGNFGGGGGRGARAESFQLLDGEPASKDILDGVDTTWGRVPGGAEVGRMADELIAQFDPTKPAASVPALLKVRTRLNALPKERVLDEKRAQLDGILQKCIGLSVETTVGLAEVVPGESMKLTHSATIRSDVPVRWLAVRYPANGNQSAKPLDLRPNEKATQDSIQVLPAGTPLTQAYWLRQDPTVGMYRVEPASLIGCPENPPAFPVELVFEVGGQTLTVPDVPVEVIADPNQEIIRRRLDVISPVSLKFSSEVELFTPSATKEVAVEGAAARPGMTGTIELDVPPGWKVSPVAQSFSLAAAGEHKRFTFTVTAPDRPTTAELSARAQVGGKTFGTGRIVFSYPHIPRQLLQPPARLKAVDLELAIRGHKVGYVPGAGDSVAEAIEQMGYSVTRLTGDELTPDRLRDFDAVVFGVRAFNVRPQLASHLPAVFAYVENGGNVIEQYNRPDGARVNEIAPYELRVSGERVTDETAPVTFLAPEHPALNTPNKITSADFEGWVQERGVYFPNQWDAHFTPLLACGDPGEAPLKGGLLVAQHGRGYFVYTGLAWFRQLPAGVPGAYRLFANLVSLGKSAASGNTGGSK